MLADLLVKIEGKIEGSGKSQRAHLTCRHTGAKGRVIGKPHGSLRKPSQEIRLDQFLSRLDLTKRRLSILNEAKEFAKGIPSIDFAFCDINCN